MKVPCYCKEGTSSSSFHYNLSSDEQCLVENYSDMYEALSCSMYEALAKQILGLCFLLVFFLLFIYNCWTKRIIQLWNRMSRVPSKIQNLPMENILFFTSFRIWSLQSAGFLLYLEESIVHLLSLHKWLLPFLQIFYDIIFGMYQIMLA